MIHLIHHHHHHHHDRRSDARTSMAAASSATLSSRSCCCTCTGSSDPGLAHLAMATPFSTPRQRSSRIRRRIRSPTTCPSPSASLLPQSPAEDLLHNHVLLAVATVSAVGQVLKPFTSALRGKGFNWKLSISSGGMPSVHSASVTAACTAIALERGIADSLFGLAVVFAAIVMYDAQGVRRAVGKQAEVINKVVLRSVSESFPADENYEGPLMSIDAKPVASEMQVLQGSIEPNVNIKRRSAKFFDTTQKLPNVDVDVQELDGWQHVPLKESVGHTKLEVIVGGLWGILCTLALSHLPIDITTVIK